MRFKRIDTETVRCLISESELNENGLEIEDFLSNKGKTEDFLRKIITMAEQEVDYRVQGGAISVQVAVLEDNTLALTLSEKQEKNVLEVLENLKSAVEVLAGVTEKSVDALKENKKKQKTLEGKAKKVELGKRLDRDVYELEFTSMDYFMRYCDRLYLEKPLKNCLYKLPSNGYYYLLLEKEPLTDNELCKLLGASLDYTNAIYSDGRMKAFLEEHAKCMMPQEAVQHIKML